MKKLMQFQKNLIAVIIAIVVFLLAMATVYVWSLHYNKTDRRVSLADGSFDGEKYVFADFTVQIGPRGGDSGAWLKDPIYDEAGNELHGASVGTIYEIILHNKSDATITDWNMEVFVSEYMWLNNAWNGTMELRQTTSGEELVQELDLSEYTQKEIILDYYLDHTGPMIPLNEGDSFVYIPSQADNEMPLVPSEEDKDVKDKAIVGFIIYVPDQTLDYVAVFDEAVINYHMQKSVWDYPIFIFLLVVLSIYIVILITLVVSQIRVNKLLRQQKHDAQIIEQSISTFINFIEAKDPQTKGHSERVARYSYLLAQKMGYSERECNRISYVALMHDCGKISIPVTILQKKDKLTKEEYEVIKSHTTYGNQMLRDFSSIDGISMGALYHHERYDGKGYPSGIAGEEIPMIARIIGVADSLDAMNSNRCYRPRLTKEVIIQELINNKGKQFDATVVDYVIELINEGKIIIGEEQPDNES
ncbi:MAG: HD-GYP domain-containing protein [Lachnospiraceae bacterium]|nr:HD-GYP domain-containing protein [Lachnospiraceae bacterium]